MLKKEWYRTAAWIAAVLIFMNGVVWSAHHCLLQRGIAEKVLRFHVLANSDSEADQQVKLKVRDGILNWMESMRAELSGDPASEREQELLFLSEHLEEIEKLSDQILKKNGMDYSAKAALENVYFPERTYGDLTFPAGWYQAFRIKLGKAKGHNWWCVLYPGLCFSDCLHGVFEDGQQKELESIMTVEEYEELLRTPKKWKIGFRWLNFAKN